MSTFKAHIFGRRKLGDREEVRMKLFNPDDTPAELGGGGGLIQKVITIPHAQILTLFSSGFTIVEPTEILNYEGLPTEIPIPISCNVIGISGGGAPYDNATAKYLMMTLSTGNDVRVGSSMGHVTFLNVGMDINGDGVLDGITDVESLDLRMKLPGAGHSYLTGMFVFAETGIGQLDGNLQDNGLALTLGSVGSGFAGNVTGGDPSNKLLVHLTYCVVKLT